MRALPQLMEPGWQAALAPVLESEAYCDLADMIDVRRVQGAKIFPQMCRVFSAFEETPFGGVKVVILGQDPYHRVGQAMGLSFSVCDRVKPPPSLRNILAEVLRDHGETIIDQGNLMPWAKQGVLLLNTVLTVEEGKPGAHAGMGWEALTDAAIAALSRERDKLVFMLWGSAAHRKANLVDETRHLLLHSAHPSPLSAYRGFNGCGHFSAANRYLAEHGHGAIRW
ncbi:MAG: uracil-DNA glycosylase [Pseudomonadota bacterium]